MAQRDPVRYTQGDDGLIVEKVGSWAVEKLEIVTDYVYASGGARKKYAGTGAAYIDPFCGPAVYTDHEGPLTCGHDAGRRDEQDGSIALDGPLHGWIHTGGKSSFGIRNVKFHWHRSGLRIDRMSASA